jgi:hypothetical protein
VELDVVVCAVVPNLDGGVEDLGRNLQGLLNISLSRDCRSNISGTC